jgi:hypothetical protein
VVPHPVVIPKDADFAPARCARTRRGGRAAVAHEDLVKGYEAGKGEYIVVEPDELAAVAIDSTRMVANERPSERAPARRAASARRRA